jgi:hypothetical protein
MILMAEILMILMIIMTGIQGLHLVLMDDWMEYSFKQRP